MASDIHLLSTPSTSTWTVLLDKGHSGQYNRRGLDMVSSIVSRSVSPGEEPSCRQRRPCVSTLISRPLCLTCQRVQLSLPYHIRPPRLPTPPVPLRKPSSPHVGHLHWRR